MSKELLHYCHIAFLSAGLILNGCASTITIKKPEFEPFLRNQPVSDETLEKIQSQSPKDAVFADLLQAFSLMRSSPIENSNTRGQIQNLLARSVNAFEVMTDPNNFSTSFSIDEEKDFRGRPHERVFASTMAGIFLMADNKCDQALPYFRNAEFLDARFQKMPFGTDAPLVYALMYRCLEQQKGDSLEIKRAQDGVFRSVRFLTMQEPLINALVAIDKVDIRPMALSNRMAYMIFEMSIYHSLISAANDLSIEALIDDATRNATIFISAIKTQQDDEYEARMKPAIKELSRLYGMDSQQGLDYLENLALEKTDLDVKKIGERLKQILFKIDSWQTLIKHAEKKTKDLTQQILNAALSDKLILNFTGYGPQIAREGSYDEISVIKPSPDGSTAPTIRERTLPTNTACGFHRTQHGGFSLTMCKESIKISKTPSIEELKSIELISLSRKATTAVGRKFDRVLKGRAQFRAATEDIATVSAWSAFFLFYMGSQIMTSCSRQRASASCYTPGYAMWAIGGITALFSGTIWLIGRSSNPAADSRYIHLMYESAWLAI